MNLFNIFRKKSEELIEEKPIKAINGVIRYPDTIKAFNFNPMLQGDFDRTEDGQIKNYLGSMGYWDNFYEADAGIPRLKVCCEYCGGKTNFHYYRLFCWFGRELKHTSYYNCCKCGKKTAIEEKISNKFERGFIN